MWQPTQLTSDGARFSRSGNVWSVCRFVHKHVVCLTVLSGLLCGDHSAYAIWAGRGLQSRNRVDERAVTDSRGGRVQTVRLLGGVSAGAPVHTDPTPLVLEYWAKSICQSPSPEAYVATLPVFLMMTTAPSRVQLKNVMGRSGLRLMQPCDTFWDPCAHTDHGAEWM